MPTLKAQVKNGRLVLNGPTAPPEGEVIYLVPADSDDTGDEDRAALDGSLRESVEPMHEEQLIGADVALAEVRDHR